MANNINELYDQHSNDPLFMHNFKSSSDLEKYLSNEENAKIFKEVYGPALDETQLMGLKKKEDTSSSSSASVGGEPMVETPPMGVQDNNQVLEVPNGAADQGINLGAEPLPELGYGKGLAPVKPVQPKDKAAVDYYSAEIKKFKDGIDKGSFQSLSSLQKFSSDPYFKQLKAEGYFDQDLKSINDSFNKNIYSKSKATFDNPTTKKQLSEVGIIPTEFVEFKKASEQIVQKKNAKPPVASDRQKLFDGYLSMYQDPYKTSMEEQTQNALVDSELQKDAERIIKEGKWNFDAPTPEDQANSDAKGFIFQNKDLMMEVNPIYIGQAVEKYVNNPISGVDIPEELKPVVAKRLERLLLANAEEKLKRDTTELKVKDLLAKEGKTIEGIKNIPNQAIEEIQKLSDQPLVDANEFKQQSTDAINNQLESLSTEQKSQLNTKFAEIKFKADNQMYANEEEYKQDYAQYVEGVNNANIALNTRRLELIGEAEKQFGAQSLTAQQQKKEKLQEIYTKYGITEKDGKLTFKDLQKVEGIYNKVYSEYDKTREGSRRAMQSAQFQGIRPGGTMDWLGDRLLGRTSSVLANIVESVDAAVGVENNPLSASLKYLQFVETNNQKSGISITGSKNASDVFEASLGTIVDQVPNLALGVTAAVLTKNPYIGGSIAWAQDTQEQVGQNYRDNFRATGSESEAREAAASTLKLQTAMYPAYLLQFAPFMEGFFSTAKGITLKTVTSDIAKFAGTEYAPELITELAQNYKNAKDSRNSKYENMTFSQYALEEGPKLALEILPSVAAMTGTAMAASRIKEQNTQKQVDAFKAALGERGMTQAVADAIDVMGEKAIFYIPEHFLMTGQITPEQFNRFSQEMGSLVSTYPQVRDTIQNDEKSKFYLDLMEQKKKVEAFVETIPDGELKDMFKAKAENIKKTMQDIVNGRDVKYTVFKGKGGFMYVTDNQTASQMITKPGTYSDAIKEGAVEVISSDEAVNTRVKELQKNLVTGAQQVEGISTGSNVNAATADNTEARNKVVAESTRDNAEVEKLFEDAQTVESAIGNILPNVRVVIHTGTSFAEKMKALNRPDLVNAKGYYAFDKRGDKFVSEIIINADAADDTTIAHEASHGILLAEFGNNPETFANMKKQLEQIVSGSDNKKLNDFIKGYSEISKPEEYLVQLTAILKSEGKNLSPGILSKIALMINDIFKKLGINIVPFKNANNTQEVVDYFNSLAASLAGGQQIERKNAVQEQTTGQVSVQPETTTGQEVVEGKPQTEPQVTPQEGQEVKKQDVVKSKKNEDNDHTVTLNGEEIGMMYYDTSQKHWVNANFNRDSEKAYSFKAIYGDILGDTKQEAIDEFVKRYKQNQPQVPQQENKVNYSDDKTLNNFLNVLNNKNPLVVNPLRPREFIYNNQAALEFSRFNKGSKNEIDLQDISVIEKGKGQGKAVMKDITNAADKSGITLTLEAKPFGRGGLNKKDLINFYKKNGFEVDWKDAYGGDFNSEQELIRYALKNESEGVPMKRTPQLITPAETLEQAGEMEEGSVPLTPDPIEIDPNIFGGKASQGEKITIPSEDLLGGKQVNVGEIFAKFKEENGRNPRVWVWMGDQLKRGEYFNPETGVKHFLEGGFNFANDPTNIENGDIWATGLDQNLLETRLPNCDFIWIMSGSPSSSYNFSKGTSKILIKEINAGFEKLVGKTVQGVKINKAVDGDYFADFVKIAENILPKNTKKWGAFLEAIKNPNMLGTSARKVFAETLLHQGGDIKISLPFQKFLHEELGIPTRDKFDTLAREKFLVDNNFVNGDLGILLKPNGQADYNNNVHDTYGSTIKGEVVGFPDRKMNVMNVLPKEALTVTSNKTGEVIENPSSPAVIKTAVGDLGKIYDSNDIDTFLGKAQNVRSEKASGTTQVATTTGSYVKAANLIKDIQGDVLDYGAGLGLGTDAMSNTLGRKVDSYEPNPERWQGKEEATYTASDQIGKKYDGIVSLNVLNVVPKDIRDAIVADIFDKLNVGGKAVISTRKWSGDVNGAKNAVPGAENKSLMITRRQDGKNVEVFQKGFDGNELVDYVQSVLGDKADVVKNTTFGANGVIITKKAEFQGKAQLDTTKITPEYNADIAAGKTQVDALKNLLNQGYSYNQIGNEVGRGNIQNAYNTAIAEMGKEVADRYSDAQEVRFREIEDHIANNPQSVEEMRADLIRKGYSDLEIFSTMNRNLFSQGELFEAFGKTYRKTVENAIKGSKYPVQDLQEVADDTRNIKVIQSVSDLTDNFVDFSFVDANILVEHMVNTIKESGLIEAANALAKHLEGKTVDQIPLALTNFTQITSIAGRILVMARNAKKDMSDLVIGSIERGAIKISEQTKVKIKELVNKYNTAHDTYKAARENFMSLKDDASFNDMLSAETKWHETGDNLMDVLEKLKLRFWNDVLTSYATRGLLSIATTPLSLYGNIEQAVLDRASGPTRALIAKINGDKTNRMRHKDWTLTQRITLQKSLGETWDIMSKGKYTTPELANRYMDGIADVNAQKDFKDMVTYLSDLVNIYKKSNEDFASAYDRLMYETQNGDIKLLDGKTYTVSSAIIRTLIGTIPEISGRMLAVSGDRIAFHGYKTRALIDYVRVVEDEVKAGKRDTELQRYIATELGGKVSKSDMKMVIALMINLADNSDFGKEEALRRVFMDDNFATDLMGGARGKIKKNIVENYLKSLSARGSNKTWATLKKFGWQGIDVATWTLSPFTRVPVNVLAAGMQKTIPPVSVLMAMDSYEKAKELEMAFNKKYGKNLLASLDSPSEQQKYEKARQELFEARRQSAYASSAVVTSSVIFSVGLMIALSGAIMPPAGPKDEDKRKLLNENGLRPAEINVSYLIDYMLSSPEKRKTLMVSRGWRPGDITQSYQNWGFIGNFLGFISSSTYDYNLQKIRTAGELDNMQPRLSIIGSLFSLGENSVQNISALQTISLLLDVTKAPDPAKAFENVVANMAAAAGSVLAPNAFNFYAKGNAQTQISLGPVFPSQETTNPLDFLGRVGIKSAAKLSRNSQIFGVKSDYFSSGVGLFGEELKLNVTGFEPGTAAAYFSAMLNPFGARSFRQVKSGQEKAQTANRLYAALLPMSMVADYTGITNDKGQPLNMWSVLSTNIENKIEVGNTGVVLRLPFDMFKKEMEILGNYRFNAITAQDIGNFENNSQQVRENANSPSVYENVIKATFNDIDKMMQESQKTYESERTEARLNGIIKEMAKRGLVNEADKVKIRKALPGII